MPDKMIRISTTASTHVSSEAQKQFIETFAAAGGLGVALLGALTLCVILSILLNRTVKMYKEGQQGIIELTKIQNEALDRMRTEISNLGQVITSREAKIEMIFLRIRGDNNNV